MKSLTNPKMHQFYTIRVFVCDLRRNIWEEKELEKERREKNMYLHVRLYKLISISFKWIKSHQTIQRNMEDRDRTERNK